MAATNAAGAHSMRYGAMRSWVTALDCVFDDGSRGTCAPRRTAAARHPRARSASGDGAHAAILAVPGRLRAHPGVRKDSSGYAIADYARSGELVDLLVGSEGTLAMFVGVEVSLMPIPAATCSLLAEFASVDAGGGRRRPRARRGRERLRADRPDLHPVARSGGADIGIMDGTETVLLVEVEAGDAVAAAAAARQLEGLFGGAGAIDTCASRSTPPPRPSSGRCATPRARSSSRLDPTLKSMQFIEDGAVPPEQLARLRARRAARLSRSAGSGASSSATPATRTST